MTPEIKRIILEKVKIYRRYVKHGPSIADHQILHDITSRFKSDIKEAKSIYFSLLGESLSCPGITPKKYCSILHSFLHKRKMSKISLIRHNNMFLTDTLVEAITFNSFHAKQCSLIERGSELPASYLLTHHRLESVNLDPAKIISIICAFDVSKPHGWDDVSVRMVNAMNNVLKLDCIRYGYNFIENSNILSDNLWQDGLPLNSFGKGELLNYFLVSFYLLTLFNVNYKH